MSGSSPRERRHRVGAVDEFPCGRPVVRRIAGREVGIVRTHDGRFFAIRNRCPHMGAKLCDGSVSGTWVPSQPGERRYGLGDQVLRCPWHGWEFDLASGRTLFGISDKRVRVYAVAVEDDEVFVWV